jgi:hypothetical protein
MYKLTGRVAEGCKPPAFQTRDRISIEVAPKDFEARHAVLSDIPRLSGPASAIGDGNKLSW